MDFRDLYGNDSVKGNCPYISPDGEYLFFLSFRNGNADVYWIDAKIIEELREK